jgi:hypothetical protein
MGKPTFDLCNSEDDLAGSESVSPEDFRLRTYRDQMKVFVSESIGNKSEPGELKHLSTQRKGHQRDSVSSGERTRTRPALLFFLTRTDWKFGPQWVIAPYGFR